MADKNNKRKEILQNQREEYLKCATNPEYFMRKYCMIQDQQKGKIPFDLYPFQERTLEEIEDNRFNVILKARQMGISTLMAAYALWLMVFNTDKNILVVALKQSVAANLVKKTKIMHDNLPSFLRQKKVRDNRLSMELDNQSQISAETTTENAGRSESLSLLIIDEAAFIDGARDLWASVQATLSQSGGRSVVLSTPENIGSWFHEVWQKAISGAEKIDDTPDKEKWIGTGENDFHPIKLHWSLHPNRDAEWRRKQGKKLPEKEAKREFDCDFSSSGTTVIEMDRIESMEKNTVSKPKYKVPILAGTSLWVWEEPQPNTNYIISADVARGDDEGDFSTFQVFTTKQVEQVAEYRARIAPDQLGEQIYKVGNIYNQALAVVERNNYGFTTLQRLIDMEYKNLLYTSSDFKIVEVNASSNKKKVYPGLKTTRKTRPLLVSKLEEFLRKEYATIRSSRLAEELKTFVWKTSKRAEHLDGFYDDLIFATMFAFWSRDTAIRVFGNEREMNKGMVRGIKNKNSPSKQIPSSGISSGKNRGNPHRDPSSGEDISWLFD